MNLLEIVAGQDYAVNTGTRRYPSYRRMFVDEVVKTEGRQKNFVRARRYRNATGEAPERVAHAQAFNTDKVYATWLEWKAEQAEHERKQVIRHNVEQLRRAGPKAITREFHQRLGLAMPRYGDDNTQADMRAALPGLRAAAAMLAGLLPSDALERETLAALAYESKRLAALADVVAHAATQVGDLKKRFE